MLNIVFGAIYVLMDLFLQFAVALSSTGACAFLLIESRAPEFACRGLIRCPIIVIALINYLEYRSFKKQGSKPIGRGGNLLLRGVFLMFYGRETFVSDQTHAHAFEVVIIPDGQRTATSQTPISGTMP